MARNFIVGCSVMEPADPPLAYAAPAPTDPRSDALLDDGRPIPAIFAQYTSEACDRNRSACDPDLQPPRGVYTRIGRRSRKQRRGARQTWPGSLAAITTILGMAPLLTDSFFATMSVLIMGGLAFATRLTRIAAPCMYQLLFYRETKRTTDRKSDDNDNVVSGLATAAT